MKQEEILRMFRQQGEKMPNDSLMLNDLILELAKLLADSRGKLSKENFEALVGVGGALYRMGNRQFQAKSDVSVIMKQSVESETAARKRGDA
jgi:hypothetical protein